MQIRPLDRRTGWALKMSHQWMCAMNHSLSVLRSLLALWGALMSKHQMVNTSLGAERLFFMKLNTSCCRFRLYSYWHRSLQISTRPSQYLLIHSCLFDIVQESRNVFCFLLLDHSGFYLISIWKALCTALVTQILCHQFLLACSWAKHQWGHNGDTMRMHVFLLKCIYIF